MEKIIPNELPEIKKYFGDKRDEKINQQGYLIHGDTFKGDKMISFGSPENPLPTDLNSTQIESHYFPSGEVRNFLCYDPNKAEVKTVKWQESKEGESEQLEKDGWQLIDSNIARGIFVRTITENK
jgi:hypothetical protein